jgi:hypothetical protein
VLIVVVVMLSGYVATRLDFPWLFSIEGRISQAGCDRIRIGMEKREVEAILGAPSENKGRLSIWTSESGIITVIYDFEDDTAQVTSKKFIPFYQRGPDFPR